MKKANKFLVLSFFIVLILFLLPLSVSAKDYSLNIVADSPCVGKPLYFETDIPDAVFTWSIQGKTLSTGESYTPTAADYENFITLTATDKSGNVLAQDSIYFSKLPVVYIDTAKKNAEITRDKYADAEIFIQGNAEYENQYSGKTKIKGRGTSSWHYDKKPYKLKLDEKANLFGFGESKHYVLLANALDVSLMRNTVGYRMSSYMGLAATDTLWVSVVMNGEYAGCYQLCESIKTGSQLIDIFDWEDYASDVAYWLDSDNSNLEDTLSEDLSWVTEETILYKGKEYNLTDFEDYQESITGGYLFELDSSDNKEISGFQTEGGIKIYVFSPEYLYTNREMFNWVQAYFQNVEDAVCSDNGYNESGQHYTELVDMDSVVNYWLCMEILSNEDAAGRSRYCSIDINGKLVFGPAWDFDISSDSIRSYSDIEGWNVTGTITGFGTKQDFWKDFVDDPYFQIKAQQRYWEIRPMLEELIRDGGIIDCYADYLYEPACANEQLWVSEDLPRSFTGDNGDVAIYKSFLTQRIQWLDSVFASEKSTTSGMFNRFSSNPYKKSNRVKLSIENASASEDYYIIDTPSDLQLKIDAPRNADITVYVNGIKTDVVLQSGKYIIPQENLTEETGCKNVINVVAKTKLFTYRNYVCVTVGEKENDNSTDISQAFCLDNYSKENCNHNLEYIDAVSATENHYGIKSCWYCPECDCYFADENGKTPLAKDEVITSLATSDTPGGIPVTLRQLTTLANVIILVLLISVISLPLIIILFKKRKRVK